MAATNLSTDTFTVARSWWDGNQLCGSTHSNSYERGFGWPKFVVLITVATDNVADVHFDLPFRVDNLQKTGLWSLEEHSSFALATENDYYCSSCCCFV